MAKRFIDTDRYRKQLRGMECRVRLAHEWLWQNCDSAGVWSTDPDLFKFECGYTLNIEALLKACPWVQQLPNGSLFIADFIEVNYGKLKDGYNPHKPVFRSLIQNGICPSTLTFQDLTNPSTRVEGEGEEEDKEEEKERATETPKFPNDFPANLRTDDFLSAFDRWVKFRKEKKAPLPPSTREAQLSKMAGWGPGVSIQSINNSIEQGWTGLFAPKSEPIGSHAAALKSANSKRPLPDTWE